MTDYEDELSPEAAELARRIFRGEVVAQSGCVHCAGIHDRVVGLGADRQPCPRVKHAVWHPDGTLLEVEYWPYTAWPEDGITFPSDVFSMDDIGDTAR